MSFQKYNILEPFCCIIESVPNEVFNLLIFPVAAAFKKMSLLVRFTQRVFMLRLMRNLQNPSLLLEAILSCTVFQISLCVYQYYIIIIFEF